jgi:hypothetical protein
LTRHTYDQIDLTQTAQREWQANIHLVKPFVVGLRPDVQHWHYLSTDVYRNVR